MSELQTRGWRDAWIERNPTSRPPASWWSPKFANPFRLDYALLSPVSPRPRKVEYLTEHAGTALTGKGALSNHAALLVDLR
jgi:hypothetical protein